MSKMSPELKNAYLIEKPEDLAPSVQEENI
jgi:hypothetical protein